MCTWGKEATEKKGREPDKTLLEGSQEVVRDCLVVVVR